MKRFLTAVLLAACALSVATLTTTAAAQGSAQKPATPAPIRSFRLVVRAPEPQLVGGKVRNVGVVKSWPMNVKGARFSRKVGKFSTLLTPGLDLAERQINARAPRPAVFRNAQGRWVATQQTGWTLDRAATKRAILKAALAGRAEAQAVVKFTVPQRSVPLLAGRGVLRHVATGRSSYKGSPSFRVTNVLVGAQKLDNFFIAPGHTFDFNREVGEIDASTGFVKGYVISDGTLSKEDGGGICQVSTTIFRALYQAGLPIVERHEHSHRVEYYDPVGFEATVYAPSKNLRMKNDSGAYLFVQAGWDTAAGTLRFDLFGADTGRTVKLSAPAVTTFKPAAKPSYTPDNRVRAGQRRLLDVPVQGMTSTIVRTVTLPGGTVRTDTLKSVYKPWGAVYGVKPGDRRLKSGS